MFARKDCYARGLGFDSNEFRVEQKVLLSFSMKFSVAARSLNLCPVNGNRLAPYYMVPKHTGELWVYIGTPLPNPSGNTGVMICVIPRFLKNSTGYIASRYLAHEVVGEN